MKPTTMTEALDRIAELESQLEHRSRCLNELLTWLQDTVIRAHVNSDERHAMRTALHEVRRRVLDGTTWQDDETLIDIVDEAMSARIG